MHQATIKDYWYAEKFDFNRPLVLLVSLILLLDLFLNQSSPRAVVLFQLFWLFPFVSGFIKGLQQNGWLKIVLTQNMFRLLIHSYAWSLLWIITVGNDFTVALKNGSLAMLMFLFGVVAFKPKIIGSDY